MEPMTQQVPKCLLEVSGRPFVHWQLEWLASQNVENVVLSIGYLGDLVRSEVGDGSKWGVSVRYVDEGALRLGTGGAVRFAIERHELGDAFFVLYGDSYLSLDVASVEEAFRARGADALMVVYRNSGRWDASNVVFRDGMVTLYQKGLGTPPADMCFIDCGLSVLSAPVIIDLVPAAIPVDLADLFSPLSRAGRLTGYEIHERFFEIGSPAGLHDLEVWLEKGNTCGTDAKGT
jgi:MurNAc alpha-1-phosphate uridylyltransferase